MLSVWHASTEVHVFDVAIALFILVVSDCDLNLDVTLSTDMIVGFCGETHEDYLDTLSLVEEVGYEMGFLFAYSMRKVWYCTLILYFST